MKWLDQLFIRLAHVRGAAAVWELAAVAAIAPYLIVAGLGWSKLGPPPPQPFLVALALSLTLLCLAALRTVLAAEAAGISPLDRHALAVGDATNTILRSQRVHPPRPECNVLTGLPSREDIRGLVDDHDH